MDIVGGDWLSTGDVVSPDELIEAIDKASCVDQLSAVRHLADRILEVRLAEGRSAKRMTRLVTDFNDRITIKLLLLTLSGIKENGGGIPPSAFTWISLGSEGRLEQTLRTDQDNALAYKDVPDSQEEYVKGWFLDFSRQMVEGLERCGFSLCSGKIMASNPQWCLSESSWRSTFYSWIENPNPITLRYASIFFDFRPLYQDSPFLDSLKNDLHAAIKQNPLFLRYMAKNALENKAPLGFLRQIRVKKSGPYKGQINIKIKGLTPIVDAARVLSLDLEIKATNTLERLEGIAAQNVLGKRFTNDLREAYSFLTLLKIALHLDAKVEGTNSDNYLSPDTLSNFRLMMLKESFLLIKRLQETLKFRYQTDFIMGV